MKNPFLNQYLQQVERGKGKENCKKRKLCLKSMLIFFSKIKTDSQLSFKWHLRCKIKFSKIKIYFCSMLIKFVLIYKLAFSSKCFTRKQLRFFFNFILNHNLCIWIYFWSVLHSILQVWTFICLYFNDGRGIYQISIVRFLPLVQLWSKFDQYINSYFVCLSLM